MIRFNSHWYLNTIELSQKIAPIEYNMLGAYAVTLHWVIPENIHTLPRAASSSGPPLALGNSKMLNPPLPSEFQTVLPLHAFGIP